MDGSSKLRKSAPRDAASKVAQQRMSVLELARELGNVAEACRLRGMDRASFAQFLPYADLLLTHHGCGSDKARKTSEAREVVGVTQRPKSRRLRISLGRKLSPQGDFVECSFDKLKMTRHLAIRCGKTA